MENTALIAISPLDGRYGNKLAGFRQIFSEYGLMKHRLIVEIKWLIFLTQSNIPGLKKLDEKSQKFLLGIIHSFDEKEALRVKEIENTINHDVKAIEYYIKEKIKDEANFEHLVEFIHFGCTSEDINNIAYALMIKAAAEQNLLPALNDIQQTLRQMAHTNANLAMLARTHGQAATPTTLGKEIANVIARLQKQINSFKNVNLPAKLNGAVGNFNAFLISYSKIDWQMVTKEFIHSLSLDWNEYTTQIEPHDNFAELFLALARINTIFIDFNRDMWSYISLGYFIQQKNDNEVGSSTMPHKINPIDFENAEGNLGIANALLYHMSEKLPISRLQRDLSDSTVLRNIGVAFAHALLGFQSTLRGIKKVVPDKEKITSDLDNHWEVLAEAIQTIMRRYHCETPYEKLKAFTRGNKIDKKSVHAFIKELDLPDEIKKELLELTPSTYIGYAEELAKKI